MHEGRLHQEVTGEGKVGQRNTFVLPYAYKWWTGSNVDRKKYVEHFQFLGSV